MLAVFASIYVLVFDIRQYLFSTKIQIETLFNITLMLTVFPVSNTVSCNKDALRVFYVLSVLIYMLRMGWINKD